VRFLRARPDAAGETTMMMQMCGSGTMAAGILAVLLSFGLRASLIVLVWVVIGRLRLESPSATAR
jgi:hypothetical protein